MRLSIMSIYIYALEYIELSAVLINNDLKSRLGGLCGFCGGGLKTVWHIEQIQQEQYPSCQLCNKTLKTKTLEEFRNYISRIVDGLRDSSEYRTAERFGVVCSAKKAIKFHFETFVDLSSSDDEKLKRRDLRDRTHIHTHLCISFLLLDSGWFFWSVESKRWLATQDQSNNELVVMIKGLKSND